MSGPRKTLAELQAIARVDRTGWPSGPWDDEPDRVDFHRAGYPCLLLRDPRYGHWCGYVGVREGHPALEIDLRFGAPEGGFIALPHGGLNYGPAPCDQGRICQPPFNEDPVRWFGFDCGHIYDFSPGDGAPCRDGVYRTVAFAHAEAAHLARELRRLADSRSLRDYLDARERVLNAAEEAAEAKGSDTR